MYNYLQKLFEDISKDYIKECFKISILPALISIGGWYDYPKYNWLDFSIFRF